jgi:hypothetical protein
MALSREQIVQEYQQYFPGREVSEQDIKNVQEKGLGVVKGSYEQITAPGVQGADLTTAAGQGQQAATGDLITQEQQVREQRKQLVSGTNTFMDLLQKGIEAKRQQAQPLEERETKLKRRLFDISPQDYEGMDPSDALSAMRGDYSIIRSELNNIENVRNQALQRENNFINGIRGMIEDQVTALGLQLEDLGFQRQVEQDAISFAFDPMTLQSGVMPENLPEQYREAWQAQSAEVQRQQALAERPRGSGRAAAPVDMGRQFIDDSVEMRTLIDTGGTDWGTAWNFMRQEYPEKSNEEIDMALGGAVVQSQQPTGGPTIVPQEGKLGALMNTLQPSGTQYYGRATPGYYESLLTGEDEEGSFPWGNL